jgi:hypothetical protein
MMKEINGSLTTYFSIGLRSILANYGAVPAEKTKDDDNVDQKPKKSIYSSRATAALSSDEEDDDDDDRGYY